MRTFLYWQADFLISTDPSFINMTLCSMTKIRENGGSHINEHPLYLKWAFPIFVHNIWKLLNITSIQYTADQLLIVAIMDNVTLTSQSGEEGIPYNAIYITSACVPNRSIALETCSAILVCFIVRLNKRANKSQVHQLNSIVLFRTDEWPCCCQKCWNEWAGSAIPCWLLVPNSFLGGDDS